MNNESHGNKVQTLEVSKLAQAGADHLEKKAQDCGVAGAIEWAETYQSWADAIRKLIIPQPGERDGD